MLMRLLKKNWRFQCPVVMLNIKSPEQLVATLTSATFLLVAAACAILPAPPRPYMLVVVSRLVEADVAVALDRCHKSR